METPNPRCALQNHVVTAWLQAWKDAMMGTLNQEMDATGVL
jgi:hypothetical protein